MGSCMIHGLKQLSCPEKEWKIAPPDQRCARTETQDFHAHAKGSRAGSSFAVRNRSARSMRDDSIWRIMIDSHFPEQQPFDAAAPSRSFCSRRHVSHRRACFAQMSERMWTPRAAVVTSCFAVAISSLTGEYVAELILLDDTARPISDVARTKTFRIEGESITVAARFPGCPRASVPVPSCAHGKPVELRNAIGCLSGYDCAELSN